MSDPHSKKASALELDRRDLFRGGAMLLVAPAVVAGCSSSDDDAAKGGSPSSPFAHGVASGDPLPDAVVLWTRVTLVGIDKAKVEWEMAEDVAMTKRVASGDVTTDADRDFTVKVDARGLAPGRTYYFRFRYDGVVSPLGRTRTTPTGALARARFAVVSCSSLAHGYFHGYRALATRLDIDAVIHLGDYIYEYATAAYGNVREYEPATEILTLADYRKRHSQYKRDADLQAIHRQHPFITVWDDHEIANDAYRDGAENHDPAFEGTWVDRKAAALRAYREWMPIRDAADGKIFRKLSYGDLVDLVMLDTRHWGRTKQAGGVLSAAPAPDPTRTLLGEDQAAWMEDTLRASTAAWKLVGQQVMLGNLNLGETQLVNLDQWHGYPESRARLLSFLSDSALKNVVFLTGDIHSSWANEIATNPMDATAYDPATSRGSLAVELVTPAISSPGVPPQLVPFLTTAKRFNPHIRWYEPSLRGFLILDVTRERLQGAWFHFDDIEKPDTITANFATAWSVKSGETRLNQDASPAADVTDVAPAAP